MDIVEVVITDSARVAVVYDVLKRGKEKREKNITIRKFSGCEVQCGDHPIRTWALCVRLDATFEMELHANWWWHTFKNDSIGSFLNISSIMAMPNRILQFVGVITKLCVYTRKSLQYTLLEHSSPASGGERTGSMRKCCLPSCLMPLAS